MDGTVDIMWLFKFMELQLPIIDTAIFYSHKNFSNPTRMTTTVRTKTDADFPLSRYLQPTSLFLRSFLARFHTPWQQLWRTQ
jgi:hypothetical protein